MSARSLFIAASALLGSSLAGCSGGPLDRDGDVRAAMVAPTATLTKGASGTLVEGHFDLELTSFSEATTDVWLYSLRLYTLERAPNNDQSSTLDEHATVSPIDGFPVSLVSAETRRVPLDFTARVPASLDRPFADDGECDASTSFCLALSGEIYSSTLDDFSPFGEYSNDRKIIDLQ